MTILIPWVEQFDVETGKVLDVSCNEDQPVLDGRGRDHAVSHSKRSADNLSLGIYRSPTHGDGLRNHNNPVSKPDWNFDIDAVFELCAPVARWKKGNVPPHFTDGHNTEKLSVLGVTLKPRSNVGIRS
jgi:hypothetical protein